MVPYTGYIQPSNPRPSFSKAPFKPNPMIEDFKEKGLCYRCHERYYPGHQCKPKTLNVITCEGHEPPPGELPGEERLNIEDNGAMQEEQIGVNEEVMEVSVWVALGLENSPSTVKIIGSIKRVSLKILIDSGSTHSFLEPQIAKMLKLRMEPFHMPRRVRVANGQEMQCGGYCPQFWWEMQGEGFCIDMRLMKVGGVDIVLGMDWLDLYSPIILRTRPNSITFYKEDHWVTLWGQQEEQRLSEEDEHGLYKMLCKGSGEISAICVVESFPLNKQMSSIPDSVSKLLVKLQVVFDEPKGLPPSRECDHTIPLINNAQPFSLRPYRYSFDQKNSIEKMVLECDTCQKCKDEQVAYPGLLLPLPIPDKPWEYITMIL